MKDQHLRAVILDIASRAVPDDTVNLWPSIRQEIDAANSRLPIKKFVLYGVMGLLLVIVLGYVPPVRAMVAQVISELGLAFVSDDTMAHSDVIEAAPEGVSATLMPLTDIVDRAPFAVKVPGQLPQGVAFVGGYLWELANGHTVVLVFQAVQVSASGELTLTITSGEEAPPLLADSAKQLVDIEGISAIYAHGGWERSESHLVWDNSVDAAYLGWKKDSLTYVLQARHLNLDAEDLIVIAESMR